MSDTARKTKQLLEPASTLARETDTDLPSADVLAPLRERALVQVEDLPAVGAHLHGIGDAGKGRRHRQG